MLTTINTIAIGTIATITVIDHKEQLKEVAQQTTELVKSSYRSTKNFITSTTYSTINSLQNMKRYIKNKLNPPIETYGLYRYY